MSSSQLWSTSAPDGRLSAPLDTTMRLALKTIPPPAVTAKMAPARITYRDLALDAGKAWEYALPAGHNAFAYVFEGALTVGEGDEARPLDTHEMGVLGGGEVLQVRAGSRPARVIVVAGRPLREPVMRHGPFVMNTRQELMQAFVDFQEGRF